MPKDPSAKSSWPLLTVAALSFIPGFGFLFAAAALSWALLSDRPRARLAGALAVAGAVANLAGGAIILLWVRKRPEFQQVQQESTRRDLSVLVGELESFHAKNGRYPASLQELVGYPIPLKLINIYDNNGGMSMTMVPYQYRVAEGGATYDLFSTGPDRKPGTDDDIRPVLSDSSRDHTGYRPGNSR
jgi:hypothetical protein